MEIEAKFSLPDMAAYRRLQTANDLAEFNLSTGSETEVHDTYLDTADRVILAAGFACRRREREGDVQITLKGLRDSKSAIHRREELEISLPADRPPTRWPAGPVRDRVLSLIGESPLTPLFELHQKRFVRQVTRDERPVAELSLDEIRLNVEGREKTYLELEVELGDQGSESDIMSIATHLEEELGLVPEPRSKFERALALLQETQIEGAVLTPRDRAICAQVAKRDDMYSRRARALLALDEGITQVEAGKRADLSARRVRYWLAVFREKHVDIFPEHVLDAVAPAHPTEPHTQSPPAGSSEPREEQGKPSKGPGLQPEDSMVEAAHKTLAFHFQRMIKHEPGTRRGEDIEELHDMRVATRRMRAAFQVFGDYVEVEQVKPFVKGLRRTGRALGAVRDLDVLWEKTERYLNTLPPEQQDSLDPLRAAWERERAQARESMLEYLDSARYEQFKESFSQFLEEPNAGALPIFSTKGEPRPHRLRYVVPLLVHQRLAALRAYDGWVVGPDVPLERLHRLRIAAKRLRYTLEFFEEVLAPETKALIKRMKTLQDHLGDLQDAVVASNLLRDFLTWGTWGHQDAKKVPVPTELVVAPGVANYLAARQIELQKLLDTFPQTWEQFQSSEFTQLVAAALAAL